MFIGAFPLIIC